MAKIPHAGVTPEEVLRELVERVHELTEEDLRAIYLAIGTASRRAGSEPESRDKL
jgi:hypothetical protein